MRYLTIGEVLVIHAYQIGRFGGNPEILDIKLLESAIARPQTTLTQKEMFPTIYDKAAVLAVGIINNHPFTDGNKRTGLHSMLVFLELNGIDLNISNSELVKLGLCIANKTFNLAKVAEFLISKSVKRTS